MIIELERFIAEEQPYWEELAALLRRCEDNPWGSLTLADVTRLHYLHQRTSADLARLTTFAAEDELRLHLEALVARGYGEIHESRRRPHRLSPWPWLVGTWPRTFRRYWLAFAVSLGVTLAGTLFGAAALLLDPPSRTVLLPTAQFPHLREDPSARVRHEEQRTPEQMQAAHLTFAAYLFQNNVRVSLTALAFGLTWGVGTLVILFQNGIILGAVALDYMQAGETKFMLGWLLPHGVIEIPAIILGGQAGLVLAHALIGWGRREPLRRRLRLIAGDLTTLVGGMVVLLAWAALVESFFSQYHEPVLPYWLKITVGVVELLALVLFLALAGRQRGPALAPAATAQ